MFELFYTNEARKFLKKINKEDKKRIISVLERCRIRPHYYAKKLVSSPYFRLRAGKYRIIIDINSGKLIIMIIEIGSRKDIYK